MPRKGCIVRVNTDRVPAPCWTLPLARHPPGSVAPDLGSAASKCVHRPGASQMALTSFRYQRMPLRLIAPDLSASAVHAEAVPRLSPCGHRRTSPLRPSSGTCCADDHPSGWTCSDRCLRHHFVDTAARRARANAQQSLDRLCFPERRGRVPNASSRRLALDVSRAAKPVDTTFAEKNAHPDTLGTDGASRPNSTTPSTSRRERTQPCISE
jgi:hypothetical protein